MDYRISKLRDYLFGVINVLTEKRDYQINADMLDNVGNYSLDKIPTDTTVRKWIVGTVVKKDVYSFRSRKCYSKDTIVNLKNIGFFEDFEDIIKTNNRKGILPDIENIESIECLNCGTLIDAKTNEATFDIQIEIKYRDDNKREEISQ